MTSSDAWSETTHKIAGNDVFLARRGKGTPVLVLHHDTGTLERLPFYESLSQKFDVLVPHHPGYGRSQRPEWLRSVRDIAAMYSGLLNELKIETCALVGLGFGGWIAAEMATFAPRSISHLVLVGAMGVKPPEGDILDEAIVSYIDYARAGFHDQKAFDAVFGAEPSIDQLEQWDICREMNFRIAWKPYKYSQTLPYLLSVARMPSLIVWGDDDRIVPRSAANTFKASLPKAKLEIVKTCGHCVDMEKPAELSKLVTAFVG